MGLSAPPHREVIAMTNTAAPDTTRNVESQRLEDRVLLMMTFLF
jgi:hypothetical protein